MAKSAVVKEVEGKVIVKEGGKEIALGAGSIVDDVNNVVAVGENSKAILVLPNGTEKVIEPVQTLSQDTADALADVSDLQAQILGGDDLTDLESTAAGGAPAGGGTGGNGASLGAAGFDAAGRESTVLSQTNGSIASQINSVNATNVTAGATNVAAGAPAVAGEIDNNPASISTPGSDSSANAGTPVSPVTPPTPTSPATDTASGSADQGSSSVSPITPATPTDTTPPALSEGDIDIHTANDSVDYGRAFVNLPSDDDATSATVSYTPAAGKNAGSEQQINLSKGADGWSADSATPDGVSVVDGRVVFEAGVVKNDTPIKATATDQSGNTTAPAVEKTYSWAGQNDEGGLIVPVPLSSFKGEVDTNAVVSGFSAATALKDYADKIENDKFSAKAGEFKVVDGWYMAADGSALIAGEHAKALVIARDDKFDSYKDANTLVLKAGSSADVAIFGANGNDNITIDGVTVKYIYTGAGDDSVNLINGAKVTALINTGSGDDEVNASGSEIKNLATGAGDDSVYLKDGAVLKSIYVDKSGSGTFEASGAGTKVNGYVMLDGASDNSSIKVLDGASAGYILDAKTMIVSGNGSVVSGILDQAPDNVYTDSHIEVSNGAKVNDIISAGRGNDTVIVDNATIANGIATGPTGGVVYEGTQDTDTIIVRNGAKVGGDIRGGMGDDTLEISGATTKINGKIEMDSGNDSVTLDNGSVVNSVKLGAGDDTLNIKGGSKLIAGGAGSDDLFVDNEGITKVYIDGEGSKVENGNIYVAQGSSVEVTNGGQTNGIEGASNIEVDNARVNGHIIMSDGDDTLTIKNQSVVEHNIKTGEGVDHIVIDQSSIVKGQIQTNEGNDRVEIKDGSKVEGAIFLDDGDDTLVLDGVHLQNHAFLGKGDDTLIVGKNVLAQKDGYWMQIQGNEGNDTLIKTKETYYDSKVGVNKEFETHIMHSQKDASMEVTKGDAVSKLNPADMLDISPNTESLTLKGNKFNLGDDADVNGGWTKQDDAGKTEYQAESDGKTFTLTIDDTNTL
ncbi:hypothetical protein [Campylobacter sp. 19-13652]|uniref:hypothetical protein n=1 Tax=Campylobacter sp. 19-13652 TaxID=2840180 RepID=UPI001C789EAB|nr:hypothetical protein [Campylobacter sp. 19-13652]BCX79357.1 hypothetical protein LBC_08190 [Campylobacter sp. 19-13652]